MKSVTRTITILAFLTAFLIVSSPPDAQATTCTWNGPTGNWNEAAKWSCLIVPSGDDDAIIPTARTVTLTDDVSVGSLTLSGGTLTGASDLTAGTINWSAGTISGSGSITATTAVNFTGSTSSYLSGRTFHNAGAASYNKSGTGSLNLQNVLAVFDNRAGASFTIESSGTTAVSGYGTFSNAGTLTKSSAGDTQLSIEFVNTGVVEVESGTLLISNADPTTSSGGYKILSGATLRLSGQAYNLTGNIVGTGGGTIEVVAPVNLDGTLTFPGVLSIPGNGTLTLSTNTTSASIGILNQSGGNLAGPGSLTAGAINWSDGTMSGSGSITATTAVNFTGTAILTLNGRTFNNAGAAIWKRTVPGASYLSLASAATVFNNLAGATFTIESSGYSVMSGSGTFNNAGHLTKTSPDDAQVGVAFVNANTGVIEVESGRLVISNSAATATVSSGGYKILSGATLRLMGQAQNLTGNIVGTGEGTIEAATTVNLSGTLAFPGAFNLVSGGSLNLSTDATTADVGALNLSGGSLTGPGDVTAVTINWSAGTMSGSGATTASSAANFTGTGNIMLNGRTFNNAGTAVYNRTGTGYLYLQTAASVFNNLAGATFTVQSSGSDIVYGNGVFNNAGTLNLTNGRLGTATFTQSSGGITNLTIGGTTAVTDYCQLKATDFGLAGALNVTFTGSYTPQVGHHFILLSYTSARTGDYSPVQVTPVADILWVRYYHGNALHLWAAKYRLRIPLVMR